MQTANIAKRPLLFLGGGYFCSFYYYIACLEINRKNVLTWSIIHFMNVFDQCTFIFWFFKFYSLTLYCKTNIPKVIYNMLCRWNMQVFPCLLFVLFCLMVFNVTFNNISLISWQSVLLVEETGGPGENHRPVASDWQTLSHNVLHLALIEIWTHNNISGDRHWLHS